MAIDAETLANLDNLSPEEAIEVAKNVVDEYETLKSSTSKGITLVDQAITFFKTSWSDVEKIKALQEEHPEVAKVFLKKFYDGKTVEEIVTSKEQELESKKAEDENKVVDERYNHYFKQIPEDLQAQFKEEYDELVGKRKMTPEKVDKYVDLVIKSIRPNMSSTIEQAKLAAAWGSSVKAETKHDVNADVEFSRKLQKDLWI